MTHDEALARDAADAYVRGTLAAEERAAFEEHYFACDACFGDVQAAEGLRAAVRSAVDRGELAEAPRAASPASAAWMLPYAASVLLAAGLGWSLFVKQPALETEIRSVTAERDALRHQPAAAPTAVDQQARAESDVPLVFLEAERSATPVSRVIVPAGAARIVIAIAAPAGAATLEILGDAGGAPLVIPALSRNANGAYVVAVPADLVPTGRYRLRLEAAGEALLGEYQLQVVRQ